MLYYNNACSQNGVKSAVWLVFFHFDICGAGWAPEAWRPTHCHEQGVLDRHDPRGGQKHAEQSQNWVRDANSIIKNQPVNLKSLYDSRYLRSLRLHVFVSWHVFVPRPDTTVEIAFIPGKGLFPSSTSLHNGIQRPAGNNYHSGRLKVHIRSPEVSQKHCFRHHYYYCWLKRMTE